MDEVNASESASATNEAYAEASAEESKAVPFAPEEQLAVIENSFDTWKENNDDRWIYLSGKKTSIMNLMIKKTGV
ncbi:MAG: hypothetical protein J5802_07560 [Butyrivibrio sp.]|nr:hypothetical protein [Butyrivibrio sp.]